MLEFYFKRYFSCSRQHKKYYFNLFIKEYFKKIEEDKTTDLKEYLERDTSDYDIKIERAIFDFETRHFNYICKIL
jgi:DNA gyrase/topoisomerase IV subunit B